MWPVLKEGDRVHVEPCAGKPGVGDIIVARAPSGILVHRVLRVTDESVVMAGDNSHAEDLPVGFHAIAGVVDKVDRGGKTFTPAAKSVARGMVGRLARRTLGALERRLVPR